MKYMVGKTHSGQYEMGNEDRNSKAIETFKKMLIFSLNYRFKLRGFNTT